MVDLSGTPDGIDTVHVFDDSGDFYTVYTRVPFVVGETYPTADNVGALKSKSLTPLDGDLVITEADKTVTDTWVKGRVIVKAAGVKLVNCVVDGGPLSPNDGTAPIGLVECIGDGRSVRLERCTVSPANPSPALEGLRGWNITAVRCDIYGVTDGVAVIPPRGKVASGVSLEGCWIHDLSWFTQNGWRAKTGSSTAKVHPSDTATHNDGVQVHGGSGTLIVGCRIDAFSGFPAGIGQRPNSANVVNAAIQLDVGGSLGPITDTRIEKNWLSGGYTALVQAAPGEKIGGTLLEGNRLTPWKVGIKL